MFRSTDDQPAQPGETVTADGMATPYMMLINMNNAALVEAYVTLGIAPTGKQVQDKNYPAGFSLEGALDGVPFGEEDKVEHPGQLHAGGPDRLREAEQQTRGRASDALAIGQAAAGRFAGNSGDGGPFGKLVEASMAAASLPQVDFDLDAFNIGAAILASSGRQSSGVPDFAGSAAFTGMRADYRPESAPAGPKRTTVRRHSFGASHIGSSANIVPTLMAVMQEINKGRKRGAGTGRVVSSGKDAKR